MDGASGAAAQGPSRQAEKAATWSGIRCGFMRPETRRPRPVWQRNEIKKTFHSAFPRTAALAYYGDCALRDTYRLDLLPVHHPR